MITFKNILTEKGLANIMVQVEYESIQLENSEKIYSYLDDIKLNNKRSLVYGDYDPDGMMSIEVWKDCFRQIGYTNYTVFKYGERMHKLDPFAIRTAIVGRYDYIIISDACTNELDKIKELIQFGVKVIIVDHHRTKLTYADFPRECAIVNSTLETRTPLTVSAGALVFILLDYYLHHRIRKVDTSTMACYALISLYADCIEMSSKINRGIYYKAVAIPTKNLPADVRVFMKPYHQFTRRFIEFKYGPKLNCAFRQELFDLLNEYIDAKIYSNVVAMKSGIDTLQQIHQKSVEMTDKVTDIIEYKELDNFILANINSVDNYVNVMDNKLYNYTGLVANKLADRYGKCAVVWCSKGMEIKGSFRDLLSRNYLNVFQQFCEAEGHNSAFGMHINPLEFNLFIKFLKKIDKKFTVESIENEPIIMIHNGISPDSDLIEEIALYNEFSGTIPLAMIRVNFGSGFTQMKTKFGGYKYKWGEYAVSSSRNLVTDSQVLLKPVKGKKTRLYVV